jgi:hypothetical protein
MGDKAAYLIVLHDNFCLARVQFERSLRPPVRPQQSRSLVLEPELRFQALYGTDALRYRVGPVKPCPDYIVYQFCPVADKGRERPVPGQNCRPAGQRIR